MACTFSLKLWIVPPVTKISPFDSTVAVGYHLGECIGLPLVSVLLGGLKNVSKSLPVDPRTKSSPPVIITSPLSGIVTVAAQK